MPKINLSCINKFNTYRAVNIRLCYKNHQVTLYRVMIAVCSEIRIQ